MAYGHVGAGSAVPPNTDLIFEVEVVAVRQGEMFVKRKPVSIEDSKKDDL